MDKITKDVINQLIQKDIFGEIQSKAKNMTSKQRIIVIMGSNLA